jgi:hypothetical protein
MEETGRIAIGALSKHTGTNIETIRYYERVALLPAPARSSGGYRLYGSDHLKRLTFIAARPDPRVLHRGSPDTPPTRRRAEAIVRRGSCRRRGTPEGRTS